jgi:hypothetical protein
MRIIATFVIIMVASACANVMVVGACGGRGGFLGRAALTSVRLLNNNCMAFATLSEPGQRTMSNSRDQVHRRCYHQDLIVLPRRHRSSSTRVHDADTGEFFANPTSYPDFPSLGITSPVLLKRLTSKPLGLKRPSAVQAAVFETISRGNDDVIVGAETGEYDLLFSTVAVDE